MSCSNYTRFSRGQVALWASNNAQKWFRDTQCGYEGKVIGFTHDCRVMLQAPGDTYIKVPSGSRTHFWVESGGHVTATDNNVRREVGGRQYVYIDDLQPMPEKNDPEEIARLIKLLEL